MSCKRKECAAVVSQEQLAEGIYSMWLQTEEIWKTDNDKRKGL